MDADDAVVDLPSVAVVLPRDTDGLVAALGDAGFVHAPEGFGMRVVLGHDLLTAVA